MSGSIPSFIQPSERYEDLFKEDDLMILGTPIGATPISQDPTSASVKSDFPASDKRRFSQASGSLVITAETRSSKKAKLSAQVSPTQEVEQFYRLEGGQIPLEMVSGWSKLEAPDAAKAMLFSSGKNFFHQMRLGN